MYNSASLLGRLGKDPATDTTKNGTNICRFSVATTERLKDGERTTWHQIKAFGKLADICQQYLAKGRTVFIEGRINNYQYEKDGEARYGSEIIANTVKFIGDKEDKQSTPDANQDDWGDDIPF